MTKEFGIMRNKPGLMLLSLLQATMAYAYLPSKNGVKFEPQLISSVLGEPRDTVAAPNTPVRFHKGIDIADYQDNDVVMSIEDGVVVECFGVNTDNEGIRIKAASGRMFDYIHIRVSPELCVKDKKISSTLVLGKIIPGQEHLHLQELAEIEGVVFAVNPLRPGALSYSDTDIPEFVPETIGGVLGTVLPIREYAGGDDGTNPGVQVYRKIFETTFLVSGKMDLLLNLRDGTPARKGVYKAGVQILSADKNYSYSGEGNLTFDTVLDKYPEDGIRVVYLRRNGDGESGSDTYFGTNLKQNYSATSQARDGDPGLPLDSRYRPTGLYEACGFATDALIGDETHRAKSCVNLLVDNAPVEILAHSVSPMYEHFSGTSPVVPSTLERKHLLGFSDLVSGIASVSVTGPNGSLANWSFSPPVNSTDTYFTDMGPGAYAVKAVDAAGNETSAPFTIGSIEVAVSTAQSHTAIALPQDPLAPFTADITIKTPVSSYEELARAELTDFNGKVLQTIPLSGKSALPEFTLPRAVVEEPLFLAATSTAAIQYVAKVYDKKGNYKRDFFTLTRALQLKAATGAAFGASGTYQGETWDLNDIPSQGEQRVSYLPGGYGSDQFVYEYTDFGGVTHRDPLRTGLTFSAAASGGLSGAYGNRQEVG